MGFADPPLDILTKPDGLAADPSVVEMMTPIFLFLVLAVLIIYMFIGGRRRGVVAHDDHRIAEVRERLQVQLRFATMYRL